ncbi:MAG: hypothetical protein OXG37_16015, partial [Actinomycetia bacterium]|nr:hypothetical protein [Actinomycetes bacterium]
LAQHPTGPTPPGAPTPRHPAELRAERRIDTQFPLRLGDRLRRCANEPNDLGDQIDGSARSRTKTSVATMNSCGITNASRLRMKILIVAGWLA